VRAVLTDSFVASFLKAPPEVQKRFGQQLAHLLRDPRHPSLRAAKLDEAVWGGGDDLCSEQKVQQLSQSKSISLNA